MVPKTSIEGCPSRHGTCAGGPAEARLCSSLAHTLLSRARWRPGYNLALHVAAFQVRRGRGLSCSVFHFFHPDPTSNLPPGISDANHQRLAKAQTIIVHLVHASPDSVIRPHQATQRRTSPPQT